MYVTVLQCRFVFITSRLPDSRLQTPKAKTGETQSTVTTRTTLAEPQVSACTMTIKDKHVAPIAFRMSYHASEPEVTLTESTTQRLRATCVLLARINPLDTGLMTHVSGIVGSITPQCKLTCLCPSSLFLPSCLPELCGGREKGLVPPLLPEIGIASTHHHTLLPIPTTSGYA